MLTYKIRGLIYYTIAVWTLGFIAGILFEKKETAKLNQQVEDMKAMNIYQP